MRPGELVRIRELVATVGANIQPLLQPHNGLAKRNAYAHIWLGISTRFGGRWRESAICLEIEAFLAWLAENPNADYHAFTGTTSRLASADTTQNPQQVAETPTLFD